MLTNARVDTVEIIPFIIESPCYENEIDQEIQKVKDLIYTVSNNLNERYIKESMTLIKNG